ncbi:MAG TPA: hypothetical protein VF411_02070 [Bacteroidia bacterium]
MNTNANVQKRTTKSKANNEPTQLEIAAARFLDRNPDKEKVKEHMFDMLSSLFESEHVEHLDSGQRTEYFWIHKETGILLDAIYNQKETEVAHV